MILSIFAYDFMIRAMIAGLVLGAIAPVIGLFLVTRHYSYLADTLSHVSLLGVALGALLHIEPLIGAVVTAVVAAFGIEWLRDRQKVWGEAVLSLFLSGSLAIAIVLLGFSHGLNVNLLSILFGSITTVTVQDVYIIVGVGAVGALTIAATHRQLFILSYAEQLAIAEGLPVTLLNRIFVVLAAVTVALSLRTVGVLLVGALMVIPVLAALNIGGGFYATMLRSVCLSLVSVVIGMIVSFYVGLATGGTIVLVAIVLFILTLPLRARRIA